MEDNQIIDRVIRGDVDAYSQLIDKYKRLVLSVIFQITRNREDAEELTQDVFVRVYTKLKTHKRDSKFASWLYRIALNAAISKKRMKAERKIDIGNLNENIPEFEVEDSLRKMERDERDLAIGRAVDQLEAEEKLLISLKYYNDCSVMDIAGITGQSESNVKIRLFRIRKKLYAKLHPLLKQLNSIAI
ncbi:MAG TPA: RNA polymerase sigma factor [Cyclobacteriaceae bacterium]|nr:RNA polymerase sigma factor [Cyclobacteriaceae bacterium]